jgi:hypothetical protein
MESRRRKRRKRKNLKVLPKIFLDRRKLIKTTFNF